jgi:hypothetical protein
MAISLFSGSSPVQKSCQPSTELIWSQAGGHTTPTSVSSSQPDFKMNCPVNWALSLTKQLLHVTWINWTTAPIILKKTPQQELRRKHRPSIVVEAYLQRRCIERVAVRTTQKPPFFYCCVSVLQQLPGNGHSLEGYCLATELYATLLPP